MDILIVYRVGNAVWANHVHVTLATVHYHADVVDSNAVRVIIHIYVVAARFYIRVAAERAWAEDTARILLTRQWNARWTPSDRGADELV